MQGPEGLSARAEADSEPTIIACAEWGPEEKTIWLGLTLHGFMAMPRQCNSRSCCRSVCARYARRRQTQTADLRLLRNR